jgi:hypothetical protein
MNRARRTVAALGLVIAAGLLHFGLCEWGTVAVEFGQSWSEPIFEFTRDRSFLSLSYAECQGPYAALAGHERCYGLVVHGVFAKKVGLLPAVVFGLALPVLLAFSAGVLSLTPERQRHQSESLGQAAIS